MRISFAANILIGKHTFSSDLTPITLDDAKALVDSINGVGENIVTIDPYIRLSSGTLNIKDNGNPSTMTLEGYILCLEPPQGYAYVPAFGYENGQWSITLKIVYAHNFNIYSSGYVNDKGMMFLPTELGSCTADNSENAIAAFALELSRSAIPINLVNGVYLYNNRPLFTCKKKAYAHFLRETAELLESDSYKGSIAAAYSDSEGPYIDSSAIDIRLTKSSKGIINEENTSGL